MLNVNLTRLFLVILCLFSSEFLHASGEGGYQDMKDKMFVVHASNYFPTDGLFKPGKQPITKLNNCSRPDVQAAKLECNSFGGFRPFIAVSIGELVRPHASSWEDRPIAYITPWAEVENQVYSLHPTDTLLIGGLQVRNSNRSVLVMTQSIAKTHQSELQNIQCKVLVFDPEKVKLRSVIEEQIKFYGGQVVTCQTSSPSYDMNGGQKTTDTDSRLNKKEFWNEYLMSHPHVHWGIHSCMPLYLMDKYDYLFNSRIEEKGRLYPIYYLGNYHPDGLYTPLVEVMKKASWCLLHREALKIITSDVVPLDAKKQFFEMADKFCLFAGKSPISETVALSSRKPTAEVVTFIKPEQSMSTFLECNKDRGIYSAGYTICSQLHEVHHTLITSSLTDYRDIFEYLFGSMDKAELAIFINNTFIDNNHINICHKNMICAGSYLSKLISVTKALSVPCKSKEELIREQVELSLSLKNVVQCFPFYEGLSTPVLPNPDGSGLPARVDLERLDLNLFFLFMGAFMEQNEQLFTSLNIPAEVLATWNCPELEVMRSAHRQKSSK